MKHLFTLALACAFILGLTACQKNQDPATDDNGVSSAVKGQIAALGFNTDNIMIADGGYIVEGDIFLPTGDLQSGTALQALRVGSSEQYRTTNLVGGLPRTISVSVSSRLPSAYGAAVDEMIRRYNAENLLIRFSRVSSGGNIVFSRAPSNAQYLA
jgi:hypothetical protein